MSFFGIPQNKRNKQQTVRSADAEAIDLLADILRELKKLNVQMQLLTDEEIDDDT